MHRTLICLLATSFLLVHVLPAASAEPIAAPLADAPATRSVVAVDARTLAMHQYFYVDFPRRLQMLENEIQLAEAELALIARRVESYRPFRSFGRYAATYTADQSWQIAWVAAKHRVECLRNDQADLWRQRTFAAAAFALTSAQSAR
jgi:hypothetical protein